MTATRSISRREFLAASAVSLAGLSAGFAADAEPIIDIHQHTNYGGKRDAQYHQTIPGRTDEELLAHQRRMGISKTILLPAGRFVVGPSTHDGFSCGLEGTCTGNDACMALARGNPGEFAFGANEVSDLEDAPATIEKYLKLGGIIIAEQKFGVECDSSAMQKIYEVANSYHVPILMHWQYKMYNYGFERFYKMLEKYPRVTFIGHAQTFWANIDKDNKDDAHRLYPKGKVTPGGITDRYLSDYPNMMGDLSAGSGHGGLIRDPDFTRAFLQRHQDKLMFGSDCVDRSGNSPVCSGWLTIKVVRELAPSKAIERKLLCENAKKLFKL